MAALNYGMGVVVVQRDAALCLICCTLGHWLATQRNPEWDTPPHIKFWRERYKMGLRPVQEWPEHIVPDFWRHIENDYAALMKAVVQDDRIIKDI